jgi:hypothetical protein
MMIIMFRCVANGCHYATFDGRQIMLHNALRYITCRFRRFILRKCKREKSERLRTLIITRSNLTDVNHNVITFQISCNLTNSHNPTLDSVMPFSL